MGRIPLRARYLQCRLFHTSTCFGSVTLASFACVVPRTPPSLLQGDFSIYGGWLYISFVVNLSVCYAFYCLGMFYFVLKMPLTPFDPVPKFLCIKAVLFLSFWQVRGGHELHTKYIPPSSFASPRHATRGAGGWTQVHRTAAAWLGVERCDR